MSDRKTTRKYDALMTLSSRVDDVDASAVQACLELLMTADLARRELERRFFRTSLSEGRFAILAMLLEAADWSLTPSELAEGAGVTRATMTGLLDGLERKALVERKGHKSDRRKVVVRLTKSGREALLEHLPDFFRTAADVPADLTPAQRRSLGGLLARFGDPES